MANRSGLDMPEQLSVGWRKLEIFMGGTAVTVDMQQLESFTFKARRMRTCREP